eukprot:5938914-Pyramimonas_sp.AAC.1
MIRARTLTSFSLSPRQRDMSVEAEQLKNLMLPMALTAFASSVLPVPGGPNSSTPFHGGSIPISISLVQSWPIQTGSISDDQRRRQRAPTLNY